MIYLVRYEVYNDIDGEKIEDRTVELKADDLQQAKLKFEQWARRNERISDELWFELTFTEIME